MTVTEVRGHGKQKGHTAIYRGKEYNVSLPAEDGDRRSCGRTPVGRRRVKAIVTAARTGEIGRRTRVRVAGARKLPYPHGEREA
jgi:nitrogen regulatory protein P-II 1